eukprot:gnl/MRDRNA2_/MRDRNA2_58003_c0_seq1.p1 gnl/MRDRNA2_/MRDRNA2_58003_c0~~gnl/MRDRNA2_/MRDRNA2_58003_c0_seq1.p1  ORF type:complete len:464 (-),score=72.97 gnl/MRDRNA2_/MRDRNA2_58003_c0_seq1:93-1484(-)
MRFIKNSPLFEKLYFQLFAVFWNLVDWFIFSFLKKEEKAVVDPNWKNYCVIIRRPGSVNQVIFRELKEDECTFGYNVEGFKAGCGCIASSTNIPDNCVVLKTSYFSVNYADVCIRWGLYDSANKFVGWPIVPGFDVSGIVEIAGKASGLKVGDKVFGVSLFGGYSTRVLIPGHQLRTVPGAFDLRRSAAIPSVAFTAIHALNLAGCWPKVSAAKNKAVLIHSAAGGVGSMLCCLSKYTGADPVVGVVGRPQKVKELQAMVPGVEVINKSDLWRKSGNNFFSNKFMAVFDANGQETLKQSYEHLCQGGRLIIYGFHTNLPKIPRSISPMQWLKMGLDLVKTMPKFDPMDLTNSSKCAMGFNLSFFADEIDMLSEYFDALTSYMVNSTIKPSNLKVTVMPMKDIRDAHELISTGESVGKILLKVTDATEPDEVVSPASPSVLQGFQKSLSSYLYGEDSKEPVKED